MDKKIDEIQKLFESWKKRKLTIFGKVCVINTLAISKFLYTASILDYPEDQTIKLINKKIFQFIWNKKDRIKRNTMIGSICNGGINLVDIDSKIKSLKAAWIRKIYFSNNSLKDFLNSFCSERNTDFNYILKTNATGMDDFDLIRNFNNFYKEIFMYFNSVKKCQNIDNMTLNNILCQPLWCNKLFQYKGKCVFFENWIQSGLRYVIDIVDENGIKPIDWFYTNIKCKSNILCEYKIMANIIRKIRNVNFQYLPFQNLHMKLSFQIISFGKFVEVSDISSKMMYTIFVKRKFHKPLYQSFYSRNLNIEKSSWTNVYKNKIEDMYERKVAEFNFQLLNNILCNKLFLKKIKKTESEMCDLCKIDIEDNEHLIYCCENVKHIWKTTSKIVKFDINWKHICIGFYAEHNSKIVTLNNLISTVATIIYKYKMYCRIKEIAESTEKTLIHVKSSFKMYSYIYKRINADLSKIFDKIYNAL